MEWRILREEANPAFEEGVSPEAERTRFAATGEVFSGDQEAVDARLAQLKDETGVCHGAELAAA